MVCSAITDCNRKDAAPAAARAAPKYERRSAIARRVNEQHPFRVRPANHEDACIIRWKAVAAFDSYLASIESVAYVERSELHGRPPIGRNVHLMCCDCLAIDHERYRLLMQPECRIPPSLPVRAIAWGLSGRRAQPARCTLSTVQFGSAVPFATSMQHECHVRRQHHLSKVRRHGGVLHVAEEMQIDRPLRRFRHGADDSPQVRRSSRAHLLAGCFREPSATAPHR